MLQLAIITIRIVKRVYTINRHKEHKLNKNTDNNNNNNNTKIYLNLMVNKKYIF